MRRSRTALIRRLTVRPITTEPNTTGYAWAGSTLRRLLGRHQPVAESWPFFSGPLKPARITGTASVGGITMEELVRTAPEILGPRGSDPRNRGQKYFFVKFLDPSDFPRFAYVGFRPQAVAALGLSPRAFRAHVARLCWEDRRELEVMAELVRPRIRTRTAFERFKAAYKAWAIKRATDGWAPASSNALEAFGAAVRQTLYRQCAIRRVLIGLMHRMDYRPNQTILIETPTLHAIAGLSLQIHPKAPGNFHPKDELWMYTKVPLPGGRKGWILVEPQRTFDKTESCADFFTPFVWDTARARLTFRKAIDRAFLQRFVTLMDAAPHPRRHYLRLARPASPRSATRRGRVRWYRLIEEPGWPHFAVWELRFDGAGIASRPLPRRCFVELHATAGRITATLSGGSGRVQTVRVSPRCPVFLPASLPHAAITFRAAGPARLFWFTRL